MVQQIEQGDIFGRLGKSFGQGLGDRIPVVQQEKYLADGLKKINPTLGDVYAIPGMSERPEIAAQAMQYAQSARKKEVVRRRQESGQQEIAQPQEMGVSQGQGNVASQGQTKDMPEQQTESSKSPRSSKNKNKYLIPATAQELNERAAELSDETGITYDEALNTIKYDDNTRISADTALETRANLGRDEFRRSTEMLIQKEGKELFQDLPGELIDQFEALVRKDIDGGDDPKLAAKERSEELLNFVKSRQQVSVEGAKKFYSKSGSKQAVDNIRQSYKDLGQLELYGQDLVNKVGMTAPFAAALAYPLSNRKELMQPIVSLGKNVFGPSEKTVDQSFQKIAAELKEEDSLYSIALEVESNGGYGMGQRFLNAIAADREAGKINLNKRQIRELGGVFSPKPKLIDVFYNNMYGRRKNRN